MEIAGGNAGIGGNMTYPCEFYMVLYYKLFSVFGFGERPRLRLNFCRDV